MSEHSVKISGYASLFDVEDLGGDIVRRGAFSGSLLAMVTSSLPMLYGHDTADPIGVWHQIYEDTRGLFVCGELYLGTARADRTARLVKSKAVSGLSIGYRTVRSRKHDKGRELLELDLWEVSIVAFPMLRDARILKIDDLPLTHEGVHSEQFQNFG